MTNQMNKEELIISLIKDDLVNTKLIDGLQDIGLDPAIYSLNLSETIFKLIDFDDSVMTDELFANYLQFLKKVKHIDVSDYSGELDKLANEIYFELSKVKVNYL